jgi:hypothetical protein
MKTNFMDRPMQMPSFYQQLRFKIFSKLTCTSVNVYELVVALVFQDFQATLDLAATLLEREVVCLISSTRLVAQQVPSNKKLIEVLSQPVCIFRIARFHYFGDGVASFTSCHFQPCSTNQEHNVRELTCDRPPHLNYTYSHGCVS